MAHSSHGPKLLDWGGVLADIERYGQLPVFNTTLEHLELCALDDLADCVRSACPLTETPTA